jgi:hypothetical protein
MPAPVHLIRNGGALHAVVDIMDFQGETNPELVTCETCLNQMAGEALRAEVSASAYPEGAGELAPPDDLESLSLAEHLGILVASHVTMLEQQRDQARMWATTLEQHLAHSMDLLGAAVANWPDTSWASDSATRESLVQGIETLKDLGSPETPDNPQGDQ